MNFRGKKNYKKSNFKNNKNPKFKPKAKKKNTEDAGPKTKFQKNFRHIQRNKESEEGLRRQNETHAKYYQKLKMTQAESESESEPEGDTANPFETLLSSLSNGKNQDKNVAIESSESEVEAESAENEESELEESNEDQEVADSDVSDEEDVLQESNSDEANDPTNSADDSDSQDGEADDVSESEIAESESDEAEAEPETHAEDPFNKHLDNDLSSSLLESVTENPQVTHTEQLNWPQLGKLLCQIPTEKVSKKPDLKKPKLCLDTEEVYATPGEVPEPINHKKIDMDKCAIKTQIQPHLAAANETNLKAHMSSKLLTPLQSEVFSIVNNYHDFYYPQRNFQNGEQLRFVYCLHALNHVLKTRTKVMHHNAALSKLSAKDKNAGIPDHCRDQGLVRPKVLILLPFRDSVLRVVNLLIQLLSPQIGSRVMNHKRYLDEFGGNSYVFSQKHPKPEDFEQTFAGNTDDNFRLGISLTKKCMKLYADYYNSDIIVASPLGLRMTIGAEGDEERDYDFLASIELLIVDQAEIFFMQNWDHVLHIFDHLHLQPQTTKNTDFSRVRTWSINGWSRFYRQTLLFASQDHPEIRSIYNNRCFNYRGKIRTTNPILGGTIRHVAIQIPQIFHRIDVASIESSFDNRFDYFVRTILPQCRSPGMAHCLIFVPSYFDFVRLRNHFKKEELNFVQICEYSKEGKVARARDMFYHSAAHFLLFSERQHFFKRSRVKGIRHIVFYQPPLFADFYAEMLNLMQDAYQNPRDGCDKHAMTCTVLYTKYDLQRLAALVGSEKTNKMARASKSTHMFMNETRS